MGSRMENFKEPNIQTTSFAKTKNSRPLPQNKWNVNSQQYIERYDVFVKKKIGKSLWSGEGIGMGDGV